MFIGLTQTVLLCGGAGGTGSGEVALKPPASHMMSHTEQVLSSSI
jgi:hypothetical protein